MTERLEAIKVTVDPVEMELICEPYVVYTFRGYAPVVNVRTGSGEERTLYISPRTLAQGLEVLRQRNGDEFEGIKMRVSKESEEKFAKYVVEGIFE